MAATLQTPGPSPSSSTPRLSRKFAFPLRLAVGSPKQRPMEDWYIPYNGPYEIPRPLNHKPSQDSWANFAHASTSGETFDPFASSSEPSRGGDRKHTVHVPSIGPLNNRPHTPRSAGGVGESPVSPRTPRSPNERGTNGFSSFFSFGTPRKPVSSYNSSPTRHSTSTSRAHTRNDTATTATATTLPPTPYSSNGALPTPVRVTLDDEGEYYESYYGSLRTSPGARPTQGFPPKPPLPPPSHHVRRIGSRTGLGIRRANSNSGTGQESSSVAPVGRGTVNGNARPSTSAPLTPLEAPRTHPYAYVFPSAMVSADAPITSRLPAHTHKYSISHSRSNSQSNHTHSRSISSSASPSKPLGAPPPRPQPAPALTLTAPSTQASFAHSASRTRPLSPPPFVNSLALPSSPLRPSVSTPNLRSQPKPLPPGLPSGKDRWLSAETWCDALLFPRPRFKVREDGGTSKQGSGRIVSPPGTPMLGTVSGPSDGRAAMTERALSKSRSLADLFSRSRAGLSTAGPSRVAQVDEMGVLGKGKVLERKEKRWSKDDLSLMGNGGGSTLSLQRVLEDGAQLDLDRRAWQQQATKSPFNTRTRSLHRTHNRSKTGEGSMDWLAARGLLGSQGVRPVIHIHSGGKEHSKDNAGQSKSVGRVRSSSAGRVGSSMAVIHPPSKPPSHAHSNSQSTGNSRSNPAHTSHGQSRSTSTAHPEQMHTRNVSWGHKLARTTGGCCGLTREVSTASTLDGLISTPLPAPAQVSNTLAPNAHYRQGALTRDVSPTPSSLSNTGIGLAISTPTPSEDGHAALALRSHPYAQGATRLGEGEYAGPHPSTGPVMRGFGDLASRHRLPPQAQPGILSHHPYANPYVPTEEESPRVVHPRLRVDSTVPHPQGMFVQVDPEDVREVLPEDIKYSPLHFSEREQIISTHAFALAGTAHDLRRETLVGMDDALETGLGSGLGLAKIEPLGRRDSGLGTSEDHAQNFRNTGETSDWQHNNVQTPTISSKPTQMFNSKSTSERLSPRIPGLMSNYDRLDLPPYIQRMPTGSSANNTIASSPSVLPAPFQSPPIPHLSPSLLQPNPAAWSTADTFGSGSSEVPSNLSSLDHSPQSLDNSDDLSRFRDLFYRPGEEANEAMIQEPQDMDYEGSDEANAQIRSPESSDSQFSWDVEGHKGRGLSGVVRQLSYDLQETSDSQPLEGSSVRTPSLPSRASILSEQHFGGGQQARQPTESSAKFSFLPDDERRAMLHVDIPATTSRVNASKMKLNLTMLEPSENVPEDVESSRASSLLEPDESDTFNHYRFGIVESVVTPPAIHSDHRVSSHLSLDGDDTIRSLPPLRSQGHDGRQRTRLYSSSSLAPNSPDVARSSFMTSGTDNSRISDLSEFPSPPIVTPAHMAVIQSYFDNTPGHQIEDPMNNFAPEESLSTRNNPGFRMTFGGEDTETIVDHDSLAL